MSPGLTPLSLPFLSGLPLSYPSNPTVTCPAPALSCLFCGLTVAAQCGSASGEWTGWWRGRWLGNALDQDWGGGRRKGAQCVVWTHNQLFFLLWIIISWERISHYANGVFVLLPNLNDIMQGLALSSWKLKWEQKGRILSTTFETSILN